MNFGFQINQYRRVSICNLSMEKLFPTGNQMIDPRIRYVNEPGFMHVHRPS